MANVDRLILWEEKKVCQNCGVDCCYTEKVRGRLDDNEATVQHNYPMGHPKRFVVSLWCNRCNQADNYAKSKGGFIGGKLFALPKLGGYEIGYVSDLNHVFAFLNSSGYLITDRPTMMFLTILRKINKDVSKRKQQASTD